jgi:MraZ protein
MPFPHRNVAESGWGWFEREWNGLSCERRQEGGLASMKTECERAGTKVKGEYLQVDAKLDPKGRLVLPARLRRKLAELDISSLVFMVHPNLKAIFAFTPEDWKQKVEDRLDAAFIFDAQSLVLAHALMGGAQSVDVDKQGRILVPPKMRDEAGLDRELVLQTLQGRLEIWSAEAWEARKAEVAAALKGIDVSAFLRGV